MWERYKVHSWDLEFITTQSTTIPGQIMAWVDPDPADAWTSSPSNLSKVAAQGNSVAQNVWRNFNVCLPNVGSKEFYTNPTTSSDPRFTQCGVARVINAGGFSLTTPTTVYQIYQTVDLTFLQPELSSATVSAPVGRASTSSPIAASLLKGATVASGIPMSVGTDGTVNIDTSNNGTMNILVEVATKVANSSNVSGSFGVDFGALAEQALDLVKTSSIAYAAPPTSDTSDAWARSEILLPSSSSWLVKPSMFGLSGLSPLQSELAIRLVNGGIDTVFGARKALGLPLNPTPTYQGGVTSAMEMSQYVSHYTDSQTLFYQAILAGATGFQYSEYGLPIYWSAETALNYLVGNWVANAAADIMTFVVHVWAVGGSWNPNGLLAASPTGSNVEIDWDASVQTEGGPSNFNGTFYTVRATAIGPGPCWVQLPDPVLTSAINGDQILVSISATSLPRIVGTIPDLSSRFQDEGQDFSKIKPLGFCPLIPETKFSRKRLTTASEGSSFQRAGGIARSDASNTPVVRARQ